MNSPLRRRQLLISVTAAWLVLIVGVVALTDRAPRSAEVASMVLVVNTGGHGIGLRTESDPAVFFRVDIERSTPSGAAGSRIGRPDPTTPFHTSFMSMTR